MVPIHVHESFDLIMNESEIFSKDKSEKERFKRFETLQSSQSRNDETLHLILKKLHQQIIHQKPYGRNFICWSSYCVNCGSKVDVNVLQLMFFMVCYNSLMSFLYQRTRLKKGLVFYFKSNGIIVLKKHVDANHGLIVKTFEENL